MDEAQIPKFIIHFINLRNMHYLLNKDLSLEAKGFMALASHLKDGGIRVDYLVLEHYLKEHTRQIKNIVKELESNGYIVFNHDTNEAYIYDEGIKE